MSRDIRALISFPVLPFGHVALARDPPVPTCRQSVTTPSPATPPRVESQYTTAGFDTLKLCIWLLITA